jgi:hypothetical protein
LSWKQRRERRAQWLEIEIGLTLALIPAFSPEEKENRSPVFWNVVSRRLVDARRAIGKWTMTMENTPAKIRVSLREGLLEIEGSEEFVSKQIENLKDVITKLPASGFPPIAPGTPPPAPGTGNGQTPGAATPRCRTLRRIGSTAVRFPVHWRTYAIQYPVVEIHRPSIEALRESNGARVLPDAHPASSKSHLQCAEQKGCRACR